MSELTPVQTPARDIPPPTTISEAAQAALSLGAQTPRSAWPSPDDKAAWRERASAMDGMWDGMADAMIENSACRLETREIGGVTCYVAEPNAPQGEGTYLYIHGGAFVFGGGAFAKAFAARYAATFGRTCVSIDYRMPPDHPFPAAPEDCFNVYRALIEANPAARIVIGGGSAGGNLAAATALLIRDRGLPQPAGVVLLTPETDLTEAGDTFRTNADLDVVLKGPLPECNALYADGHDLTDPYLSPVFADFSLGYPPTLIQSGTRDLFLSNSVILHRKLREAGVEAELHVWEAMPHGGFGMGDAPENAEIDAEVARFMARVTS